MFTSFTGNSRRPRQVNLSGQNLNPFSATSWAPEASGARDTVAIAQQERQQRQQGRKRIDAATKIQRAWRNYLKVKALKDTVRLAYDETEQEASKSIENATDVNRSGQAILQAKRLNIFYTVHHKEDANRLCRLARRFTYTDVDLSSADSILLALHLTRSLGYYKFSHEGSADMLAMLAKLDLTNMTSRMAHDYYKIMSKMFESKIVDESQLWAALPAITGPLRVTEHCSKTQKNLAPYRCFALLVLSCEKARLKPEMLEELAKTVHLPTLFQAISYSTTFRRDIESLESDKVLILLTRLIFMRNYSCAKEDSLLYIEALSAILPSCASEIYRRIDLGEDEKFALPEFIRTQINTLVSKESVAGVFCKYRPCVNSLPIAKMAGLTLDRFDNSSAGHDANMICSYALLLLRMFPKAGQEIRMWLYQSSVILLPKGFSSTDTCKELEASSKDSAPAIKLFWAVTKTSELFTSKDPLLSIQRSTSVKHHIFKTPDKTLERDWRSLLLFLELYAFALRFTDDEEFLSGGKPKFDDPTSYVSRSRECSLSLNDVKLLAKFLEHFAFTMYFDEAVILERASSSAMHKDAHIAATVKNVLIADTSYEYVRDLITQVLRKLYARDSRRQFLPDDFWLMSGRLGSNHKTFIDEIVMGEREHLLKSDDSDEEESDREDDGEHDRDVRMREEYQMTLPPGQLDRIVPRLSIFHHIPFAIPFDTRVKIFRQFTYQDMMDRRMGLVDPEMWRFQHMHDPTVVSRHSARIRRGHSVDDAMRQLYPLGEGLKEPLAITFEDQFGNDEAGIDGGGVTKEFLLTVTQEAFDPARNLFVVNSQNFLYPNPSVLDQVRSAGRHARFNEEEVSIMVYETLKQYEFLGRIIGKCLYEGILIDINFAGFFLLKWALDSSSSKTSGSSFKGDINDLRDFDEELYQGLLRLKNYPGDVSDFGLYFTIDDVISSPGEPTQTASRDLMPNGSTIKVTNDNRVLYIYLVARHRLYTQPYLQTKAFLHGLGQIISLKWLSSFNQYELQTLVGGTTREVDVDDLRAHTILSGLYDPGDTGTDHPTIAFFWEVMKELDDRDRRLVLKYVTSTPRAPLLGFGALNPRFCIRDSGGEEGRLPSASTCVNLLKLPRYGSKERLREKLLYAVRAGAGFDLS